MALKEIVNYVSDTISDIAGGFFPAWIIVTVVALLVGAVYIYLSIPTWRVKHIPCPPYTWGIGHLPLLEKYQAEVFVNLARQYGPIYRFHIGRRPLVMVADADLCRELAIKNFKSAPNRGIIPYVAYSPIHLRGLFFGKDSRWSSMRNVMLPLFHSEQMGSYVPLMQRVLNLLTDKLDAVEEEDDVNISEDFIKTAMDIVGETAFGTKFGLVAGEKVADTDLVDNATKSVQSLRLADRAPLSVILGMLFPVLQYPAKQILSRIPGTADWENETSTAALVRALDEAVVKRRKAMRDKEPRSDAMSLLLRTREESKASRVLFSTDDVSALTYELLLTGSETIATAVCNALYLIADHPDVEKQILKEVDAFGPPERQMRFDDLHTAFPYVEQVIKETMRLRTATPVIARELSDAIELGGYHLPKGTWVWMAAIAMYKDPRYYPEPEKFKPERFAPDSEENKKRHPCAFLPFGLGPRTCIGYKFALQEVKMALVHLYQRFTFTHSPAMERPLATHFGIIVQPRFGVRLKVHRRR